MISYLRATISWPIITALKCPLNRTCRLIQDHHGIIMFDCRYLRQVEQSQPGDGPVAVSCSFERLRLVLPRCSGNDATEGVR